MGSYPLTLSFPLAFAVGGYPLILPSSLFIGGCPSDIVLSYSICMGGYPLMLPSSLFIGGCLSDIVLSHSICMGGYPLILPSSLFIRGALQVFMNCNQIVVLWCHSMRHGASFLSLYRIQSRGWSLSGLTRSIPDRSTWPRLQHSWSLRGLTCSILDRSVLRRRPRCSPWATGGTKAWKKKRRDTRWDGQILGESLHQSGEALRQAKHVPAW
jgi:hypothetical protein